jgi:hypothetical protein
MWGLSHGEYELRNELTPTSDPVQLDEAWQHEDARVTYARTGDILFGVGGAILAVGLGLFIAGRVRSRRAEASARARLGGMELSAQVALGRNASLALSF